MSLRSSEIIMTHQPKSNKSTADIMELLFIWQDIYHEKQIIPRNTQNMSAGNQLPKVLDKKITG
jgi:hypothetical protein